MRPVLPPANRPHPNYNVDPATDNNLQTAINELLFNAQEGAAVDEQMRILRAGGTKLPRPRPKGFIAMLKGYSTVPRLRLVQIRGNIGNILALPDTPDDRITKICFLAEMDTQYTAIAKSFARLMGQYTNAHHDLISTLGYYCSYCEIPVGIGVHVEHKMPKASYPNRMVMWDNFLLACDNCNTSKGEKPNRLTGAANASPVYNVPPPPLVAALQNQVETDIEAGSRSFYVWADDDLHYKGLNAFTYRLVRVTYDPVRGTRTNMAPINPEELEVWVKNGRVRRLPPYTGQIIIGQFDNDPMKNWEVELHISALTGGDYENAARHVINELHLNRDQDDLREGFNSDLRVPLRTDAWFKAVTGIGRLVRAYLRDGGAFGSGYRDLEDVIMETAVVTGFWLVWVKVLFTYVGHDQLRDRLLDRFLDPQLFPGTRSPF